MRFDPPLEPATFVRRYKRFLVDAVLPDGHEVVAHSTNTGALRGCMPQGAPAGLRAADNPKRKLAWTWTLVQLSTGWVVVDTSLAVPMVEEALDAGLLPELGGYARRIREVKYGREGRSRIDLLLAKGGEAPPRIRSGREPWPGESRLYIEVKATTLVEERGGHRVAMFPDAVTERGRKHLEELAEVARTGEHRAAMVYVVQRDDAERFAPAAHVDPAYAQALREALDAGVQAHAFTVRAGLEGVELGRRLPVEV